jgi:ubiquinone/menaquinone biosynthesis C-methylase UbiE
VSDHLDLLARVYGGQHTGLYPSLDKSLNPRGPELLFDVAAEYLAPRSHILDIGCRDAAYLIRLVQVYDAHGVAVDPLDRHIAQAEVAVADAGLQDRIEIVKGVMEHIEQPDDCFDFIWCRDVLECVEGLEPGLAEAARVLKPGCRMLVYTDFATELLEPREAAKSFGPRGIVADNMDEHYVEAALLRAGFVIERKDVIGTEWREYAEERSQPVSTDLLRLARLRRQRRDIVEQHGQDVYERAEGGLQWSAYQLLGKLQPTLYILARPPS